MVAYAGRYKTGIARKMRCETRATMLLCILPLFWLVLRLNDFSRHEHCRLHRRFFSVTNGHRIYSRASQSSAISLVWNLSTMKALRTAFAFRQEIVILCSRPRHLLGVSRTKITLAIHRIRPDCRWCRCQYMTDWLLNGFVTDYIQVGVHHVFNIPDSLITIGAALLLWQGFWDWRRKRDRRSA